MEVLQQLRNIGVKTGIDDFGTGYSSLHILKELPIDTIKIDRIFIDDCPNSQNYAIVKAVNDIALHLNLRVVAEGIETEQQLNALTQINCGFGQGFYSIKL